MLTQTYIVFETDRKFELQWWGGYTRHNKIWREKTLNSSTN